MKTFDAAIQVLALTPLAAAGVLALRRAWARKDAARPGLILAGWATGAAVLVAAAFALGPARGPFAALALASVAALGVVAAGVEFRQGRRRASREAALEPSDRPRRAWRGWLRAVIAGPLAGVAALGVGLAVAVCAPFAVQSRMVVGGLLVPFLWAGGMAWTLSDDRILRAAAVLTSLAVLTLGAAFLRGAMA